MLYKQQNYGHVHRRASKKGLFYIEFQLAKAHLIALDVHFVKGKYQEYALAYHNLTWCKRYR